MPTRRAPTRRHIGLIDQDWDLGEAELRQVQVFAEDLPDRFLQCRELGHTWKPYSAATHPEGGFERTLRCGRCRTLRIQHLSTRGQVIRSNYKHAEGYLSDIGRITGEGRGLLRLESMSRMDIDGRED